MNDDEIEYDDPAHPVHRAVYRGAKSVDEKPPVEIPADRLSEEAMNGVVENFILREGTDYGATETSYDTKAKQIWRQIEGGDIKIVFDPNSETVTLMTAAAFRKLNRY